MNDKYTVTSKWILVSDHLPKTSDTYIVTAKIVTESGECLYYKDTVYFDDILQKFMDITWEHEDIVAWMDLPEPLKEG